MILQEIYEKLSTTGIDSNIYKLVYDKKNRPNLHITYGGSQWYLYNPEDVELDAQSFAEKNYSDALHIILLGAGFGYHIRALLEMLQPRQTLHVFEPNLSILKIALEELNPKETYLGEILKHENVRFYTGGSKELLNPFCRCLSLLPEFKFISHMPGLRSVPAPMDALSKMVAVFNIRKTFKAKIFSPTEVSQVFGFNPAPVKPYHVIILGLNKQDSMFDSFFENLRLAFLILGCHVDYIQWSEFIGSLTSPSSTLIKEQLAACDFVICGDCGLTAGLVGNIGILSISIGMDRPFIFGPATMNNGIQNAIYTWVDKTDIPYAEKYYHKDGYHVFLPHSAEINLDTSDVFKTERYMDVLVSCTCFDFSLDEFLPKDLPFDRETVNKIMAHYMAGGKSWETCVEDIVGLCSEETMFNFMTGAAEKMEFYTRWKKRAPIIKALLEGGVTVHCFGNGWDKPDLANHPGFLYHGNVSCEPGRELFKHAKIQVNISHYFNSGAHDRIFSSMIRGALCFAEHSEYLDEIFTDEKDIVFYDSRDLNGLVDKVKYYLNHDKERLRIIKAAFEKVRREHTWLNRAVDIIKTVETFTGGITTE